MGRASVFENRKWVPLFAGSAALSWACAFPLIKPVSYTHLTLPTTSRV